MAGGACREKTSTGDGDWGRAEMALGTPGAHSTPSCPSDGKQRTEGTELLQDGTSLMFYFSGPHRKPPWGCIRSTARATGHRLQVPGLGQPHREDEAIPPPHQVGWREQVPRLLQNQLPQIPVAVRTGGAEPARQEAAIHSQQLPHVGPNKHLRRCPFQGGSQPRRTQLSPSPPEATNLFSGSMSLVFILLCFRFHL